MLSKKHFINWISSSILFFISQLFLIKYLSRYTEYTLLGVIFYTFIYFGFLYSNKFITNESQIKDKKYFYILIAAFSVLLIILINFIPFSVRVNRFDAIRDWLINFEDGIYPYLSRNNPSGFPFLFLLAYPFYKLGALELLSVAGIIIFSFLAVHYSGTKKEVFIRSGLILLSLPFYYEYLVRSELIFNIALAILLIFLTYKYVHSSKVNLMFLLFSILWGLLLATRLTIFVIFALFLLYKFRQNLFSMFLFTSNAILVFLIINLPFFLWYPQLFIIDGPFAIQASYLPFGLMIFFLIIIVYSGWVVNDLQELFFMIGVALFLLTLSSFVISIWNYGVNNSLINSYFDIAYFIFPLPFLILSVKEYKIDRFLGKVLS